MKILHVACARELPVLPGDGGQAARPRARVLSARKAGPPRRVRRPRGRLSLAGQYVRRSGRGSPEPAVRRDPLPVAEELRSRPVRDPLGSAQRDLPRIYLEHDPPRTFPTAPWRRTRRPTPSTSSTTRTCCSSTCTHFNNLMWDNGRTPTRVIEHGVIVPDDLRWTGELHARHGRGQRPAETRPAAWAGRVRSGCREQVPLDLAGMESADLGGWDRSRCWTCGRWRRSTASSSTRSATRAWGLRSARP